METKAELRRRIRQEKARRSPAELAAKSAAVWAQVEALPEFQAAHTVAAYWSLPDEVDTHAVLEKWSAAKRIFLPAMCGQELELREYRPGCHMHAAAFGVCEPARNPSTALHRGCNSAQDDNSFPPEKIDLILVPGVAFDRQGRRLGRGKGFYDRLLARTPALKVGVCFDFQLLDHIPVEAHDIPMGIMVNH